MGPLATLATSLIFSPLSLSLSLTFLSLPWLHYISYALEVPSLIQHNELRPADILAQPGKLPPGSAPGRRTAYGITVRSPFFSTGIQKAASTRAGGAIVAARDKRPTLRPHLRNALNLTESDPIPNLERKFYPLVFDTYGAPAPSASSFVETPPPLPPRSIAFRRSITFA